MAISHQQKQHFCFLGGVGVFIFLFLVGLCVRYLVDEGGVERTIRTTRTGGDWVSESGVCRTL